MPAKHFEIPQSALDDLWLRSRAALEANHSSGDEGFGTVLIQSQTDGERGSYNQCRSRSSCPSGEKAADRITWPARRAEITRTVRRATRPMS